LVEPKNYLKKQDIPKLEEIKKRLGKSEEMMEIRKKYKGRDITAEYLQKVPMYQRQSHLQSQRTVMLLKEIEEKKKEVRDRAKPIDYNELKEHQERVDRFKAERSLNRSVFTSQPDLNLDESLAAIKEGSARRVSLEQRNDFLRRREKAKAIDGKSLKIPSELKDYKMAINEWAKQHQRAKDLKALAKEKGHEFSKLYHKTGSRTNKNSANAHGGKESFALKIEQVSDLDRLNKSVGADIHLARRAVSVKTARTPMADREMIKHKGNQHFKETNRIHNSQKALEQLLLRKNRSKIEDIDKVLEVSSLFDQRAKKADQIASLYKNSSRKLNFVPDTTDLVGDQWTKAIESKLNLLESIGLPRKSSRTANIKAEPVKLPPINSEAKLP
jgi:hypothetical protein